MTATLRVLFAGGGTGGHLFPGLAIADEIKRRAADANITFIGTKDKIEARVVPQRGYTFAPIWISGFRRKLAIRNLLFPLKVVTAIVQSFFLIKKMKPDVVVGTGGYVCGPPLLVASLLGVPTVIQEQNSLPGVTTKLLAARATEVHVSFEMTRKYLKRQDNVRVSGNPTMSSERVSMAEGATFFNLNPAKKTLLVFGGSLGASSINKSLASILPDIRALDMQIVWQTGEQDLETINREVERIHAQEKEPFVRVYKFIDKMQYAYSVCHLAVCRAGATTLSELTSFGIPAVLVPYPFAAADHQRLNAITMVQENAAVMIEDSKLEEQLYGVVKELITDQQRLNRIAENAAKLGKPEAAATIAGAVLTLAKV
ncbi:MAG: undecaprenyldiphospho-muramoylpentapeptide beta-N-acetylglucosaminyltransferase [Ignavibacteriae bacterium]|nr:undecaprenyldiphospho-muramoylpentapeptide beta-N-acetylglucosaminyltransferase [Ignavibacteriota bacterium]